MNNDGSHCSTSSSSPTKAKDRGTKISTQRSTIVATLLLCSSFTIINVHIGYKNLNVYRNLQRSHYEHNHAAPDNKRRRRKKTSRETSKRKKHHRRTFNVEHTEVSDGKYLSQLLRGDIENSDKIQRFKFKPGTLDISSTQALQHCHVDTAQYEQHFVSKARVLVSVSETHKLIYRNIPKSASSSSRQAMEDLFDGEDMRMKIQDMETRVEHDGYQVLSFIRDPLDRFYSSYDEAYFRKGPWFGEGRLVKNRPGERKGYHKNKYKLEPYPYLYEGMKTYDDYRDKFCDKGSDKDCKTADTIDDGDLTRRFEQFVHDYNGLNPFDVHLSLQVPFLVHAETGVPFPVSKLYNASTAENDWMNIANAHGVQLPDDGLIHGRRSPRRFNMSLVTDETKRKICEISMLDYCCLNLDLPDVCKYELSKEESIGTYSCALEFRQESFHILPWSDVNL